MDKLFKPFYAVLISLVVTIGTVYLPVNVNNQVEMSNVKLGYPIPFVNQTLNYNPPNFPRGYRLSSVLENPTKMIWTNFLASFLLIFLSILILVFIYKKARSK